MPVLRWIHGSSLMEPLGVCGGRDPRVSSLESFFGMVCRWFYEVCNLCDGFVNFVYAGDSQERQDPAAPKLN